MLPFLVSGSRSLFPVSQIASTVRGLGGGGSGPQYTAFDGPTSTNVTLSNGNLTAAHANSTAALARSANVKSASKFYFEVVLTIGLGSGDSVGLCTAAATVADVVVNGLNCTVTYKGSGNIYSNGANSGKTLGAIANGDRLDIAVDFGNQRAWIRKNGGNWNGDVTGDPVGNVAGVTITATAMAPCVSFDATGSTQSATANFGAAAFAGTAPSGFVGWPLT